MEGWSSALLWPAHPIVAGIVPTRLQLSVTRGAGQRGGAARTKNTAINANNRKTLASEDAVKNSLVTWCALSVTPMHHLSQLTTALVSSSWL